MMALMSDYFMVGMMMNALDQHLPLYTREEDAIEEAWRSANGASERA